MKSTYTKLDLLLYTTQETIMRKRELIFGKQQQFPQHKKLIANKLFVQQSPSSGTHPPH